MLNIMEDLSNPALSNRPYTRIVSQKRLTSESQYQSIESLKRSLTLLQKGKARTRETVQVLLDKLNLAMKIVKVEKVHYNLRESVILCYYIVTVIGDIGPLPLILRATLNSDITKNMKEGNIITLNNLRLIAINEKPQLASTSETRITSYRRFKKKGFSRAECLVEGLIDVESLDAYKKLLEMKKTPSAQLITDVKAVLRWPIPESCKSNSSKPDYIKFRVGDISQLTSKSAALIGRIASRSQAEDSMKIKLESIQSHDSIAVFVKGISHENEILFNPGRLIIFSSLELRLSTQGTIYAITDFSLRNFRIIGNMSNKALERIRKLTIYPLSNIINIVETCAIRNVLKLWVNMIQLKHMQLWNACSVCEARLEKTDFCPTNCKNSHIVLRGKVIVIVQDGTGRALMFLKDKAIPAAFGLDEEKVEMIKGWIRGQGEFNLVNKQKLSWSEIWRFFSGCEMRRVVVLCCPFCKGITKAKDEVESITVPLFIKGESSAEIYINGEIQGGVRGAKGLHDICLKVVAVLEDELDDIYQELARKLTII